MSTGVGNTSLHKVKIERIAGSIAPLDEPALQRAQARLDGLTKPKGSLGRLEEVAASISAITGSERPSLGRKVIFTLAADHGVCEEGVSAFPQEVTAQMVYNFLRGGAAINVLASHAGAEVIVVDMGIIGDISSGKANFINKKIARGTRNFSKGPAMTHGQAYDSIAAGMEVFDAAYNTGKIGIAGVGEMGIGNTASSSAIASVMTGLDAGLVTGRGTGLDDESYSKKVEVIRRSVALNRPDPSDPVDVLAKVGGFEIGGIAGIILSAASKRVPVVVDGFISSCGAMIACALCGNVKDYLIMSHQSVEAGHAAVLRHIGKKPLLNLDMRLGEGTGAALGISVAEAAIKLMNGMATFGEAGVSENT
ncbi:MAG: nicotinate-nucleotide--dimethylbenzimidazole phosphoribosyltransferase [Candidatus Omnitrophota bacterium]|jgi:nicotinate-nucleotide--dimethylbenzimidazole phosphoribosyltransferase